MKRHVLFFLLILLSACSTAPKEQFEVSDVPNTRLESNFIHISDPDDWVSEEYENKINSVLDSVRSQADVFIVALSSIGDQPIEKFATDLFEYWGIGDADRDNGLLILMVEDQHKIKIETGYGLESVLTDAQCQQINDKVIIPHFKEGEYGEGLYAGACAVAMSLGYTPGDSVVNADEISHLKMGVQNAEVSGETDGSDESFLQRFKSLFYSVIEGNVGVFGKVFIGLFLLLALGGYITVIGDIIKTSKTIRSKNDDNEVLTALSKMRKQVLPILLLSFFCCLPLLPAAILYLIMYPVLKKKFRYGKRTCSQGHQMHLLTEEEEDVFMTENQMFEENLGVKDYDVWLCDSCGEKLVLGFENSKADRYSVCPACQCQAAKNDFDRTIVAATTSHTGEGEHHYVCCKCGHEFLMKYTIPKRSSSSGSSSSYGHSYSRGGGSFGGGRSGGGGHTGSW